jgi:hypothetical protein
MVLLNNLIIGANIGAKRRGKITAGGGKNLRVTILRPYKAADKPRRLQL